MRHPPSPLRGGGTTRSVVGGGLAAVDAGSRSRDALCIRVLLRCVPIFFPRRAVGASRSLAFLPPRGPLRETEGWRAPGLVPGGQSAFGGTVRAPAAVVDRRRAASVRSRLAPPQAMEGAPSPASPARPQRAVPMTPVVLPAGRSPSRPATPVRPGPAGNRSPCSATTNASSCALG
jgi:hypothetical protein